MTSIQVAAFYHFVPLGDLQALQASLLEIGRSHDLKGSILLAEEGINGTMAGTKADLAALITYLQNDPRFAEMEVKYSWAETMPFQRLKVRLKKEIVHLGVPVDPRQQVGVYVEPTDWNQLIADPEVLVIDTRNNFEVEMGTFEGALNPQTAAFKDFPAYVQENLDPAQHKKIAMFCTGGIRCEKATSYLLNQGFEGVYHLKGGILRYLEQISPEESLWQGNCFIFDERVALTHGLGIAEPPRTGEESRPQTPQEQ